MSCEVDIDSIQQKSEKKKQEKHNHHHHHHHHEFDDKPKKAVVDKIGDEFVVVDEYGNHVIGEDVPPGIDVKEETKKRKKEVKNREHVKPVRWFPLFTLSITILQIAMLIVICVDGGIVPFLQNPSLGPPEQTLIKWGAKVTPLIRELEFWRLFTAFILHEGILHCALDVVFQMSMALSLELNWGFLRVGPIYILAGIGGYTLSALFLPATVSVGSNPPLTGLMGAQLANYFVNYATMHRPIRGIIVQAIQILIFLLLGFLPIVDNFGNLGGLFVGFFSGLLLIPKMAKPKKNPKRWLLCGIVLRIIGLAAVVAFFGVFLPWLFGAVDFKCNFCQYMNPTWDQILLLFGYKLGPNYQLEKA